MAESTSAHSSVSTMTPDVSASMSLGNSMLPAAATREATPDKVNETDYKLSL